MHPITTNVEYHCYHPFDCKCYCQSACECMEDVGATSTWARVGTLIVLPEMCTRRASEVLDSSLECSVNISLEIRSRGVGATLDGQRRSRLFSLSGGCSLTLRGLTLVNGYSENGGGAIQGTGAGSLKLADSSIKDSESGEDGGGIAMAESGDVELERSSLSGCRAKGDGGGISIRQSGALALTDSSSIADCSAGANGGGIAMAESGKLSLSDSAVTSSTAERRGGGVKFESATSIATLVRSNLSNNRASTASAFFYSGWPSDSMQGSVDDSIFVSNIAVRDGVTILANSEISWFPCPLGEWMPTRGAFEGDVLGCNACPERYYGDATNLETARCSGICPFGFHCAERTVNPTPCAEGTYMPLLGASRAEDCLKCPRGQYQSGTGQANCTVCPTGTYSANIGSSKCEDCEPGGFCEVVDGSMVRQVCPAGRYNPETRSTSIESCLLCPAGTSGSKTGADSIETCEPCRAGSFGLDSGLAECGSCAGGTYQNDTGATGCRDCEKGSYCEPGASKPLSCEGGSYSDKTDLSAASQCTAAAPGYIAARGSTEQTACGEGSFASGTRNEVCELCVEGSYQGATAASECTDASPGHFATTGSTQQTACAKGSYTDAYGQGECTPCAAGTYQDEEGKTACKPCKAGSYCQKGVSAPLPCEAGSYSRATNLTAASECTACPTGSACSTGSVHPTPCSPGTFAAQAGRSECESCLPGTSSDQGSDACDACEAGRYAANAGQGLCVPCPHPLSSANGSTTCSFCMDDYYLQDTFSDPGGIFRSPTKYCKPCPPHADCPDGTTLETLVVLPGYWRASFSSAVLTACRAFGGGDRAGEARCAGNERGAKQASRRLEAAGSNEYCASDFKGPECQLCVAENHYLVNGVKCDKCLSVGGAAGRIAGIVLSLCVACGLAAYCYSRTDWREKSCVGPPLRFADRTVVYYVGMGLTAKMKILFSFWQVCIVLSTTYSARLPEEYTSWTDAVSKAVAIDWSGVFLPAQCLSYRSRLVAIAVSPIGLIALFLLAGIGRRLHARWRAGGSSESSAQTDSGEASFSATRRLESFSAASAASTMTVLSVMSTEESQVSPSLISWRAEAALGVLDLTPACLVLIFCFVPSISASIFRSWSCQAPHLAHPVAFHCCRLTACGVAQ